MLSSQDVRNDQLKNGIGQAEYAPDVTGGRRSTLSEPLLSLKVDLFDLLFRRRERARRCGLPYVRHFDEPKSANDHRGQRRGAKDKAIR